MIQTLRAAPTWQLPPYAVAAVHQLSLCQQALVLVQLLPQASTCDTLHWLNLAAFMAAHGSSKPETHCWFADTMADYHSEKQHVSMYYKPLHGRNTH